MYFYFHISCWWKSCNGNKIRGNCRIETRFGRLYSACSIYTGITYMIKLLIHVLFYSGSIEFSIVICSPKQQERNARITSTVFLQPYFYALFEEEISANIPSAEFPISALLLRKISHITSMVLISSDTSYMTFLRGGEGRSK